LDKLLGVRVGRGADITILSKFSPNIDEKEQGHYVARPNVARPNVARPNVAFIAFD
jgi:hypothetical protein